MGFTLLRNQPHITGERSILSLNKLVLLGINSKEKKVVIKTAYKNKGKRELELEQRVRSDIEKLITRHGNGFTVPKEIFYGTGDGFLFFITEYINQKKIFTRHNLDQQFIMLKNIIDSKKLSKKSFPWPIYTAKIYLTHLKKNIWIISRAYPNKKLTKNLHTVELLFKNKKKVIDKFSNYLIHDDLMPHNFRINNKKIYLLDYSAIAFGNKFSSWARILNYFTFSNPRLEKKITGDFKKNLTIEELECLHLFRLYKAVTLLAYYTKISKDISGKFLKLTKVRIGFWQNFLAKLLDKKLPTKTEIARYIELRDTLRSEEEKKRQKEIGHIT